MRRLPALLLLLLAAGGCRKKDAVHERYLEARQAYVAIFARTLDGSCPEEPACAGILAALAAVPADHPDGADARRVLERIRQARAEREAADVPGFLRGGEPALPGPDEVPAFLRERTGAAPPAPGPAEPAPAPPSGPAVVDAPAPTEPGVAIGEDASGTTVLIVDGGEADPRDAGTAGDEGPDAADEDEGQGGGPTGKPDSPPAGAAAAARPDPCARYREGLAMRKDWLARTAAEANTIAHVTDPEDHAALLQLKKMQRCGEHPDDPDCAPPPIQAPIDSLEVDPSDVSFEPDELTYEGQNPDDLPHDPVVRALENLLRKCAAGR